MSALAVENYRSRTGTPAEPTADPVRAAHMANSFLRTALDQASEGIMIVAPGLQHNLGPRILLHNTRMAALVGAEPRTGLCDRFITQLAATEEEATDLLRVLRATVKQGGAAQWEGGLRTLFGGKVVRCIWRIRAVMDEHGRVYNYTLSVTQAPAPSAVERNGYALEGVMSDSRRLRNDNLATMAVGVFHDLNNLLGIMMTNLSEAAMITPPQGQVSSHVDEALAAARQACDFVKETMRMAKDMPENRSASDVAQIIRMTARITQSGSGVNLHMSLPKDLWWAVVDAPRISQVLQNLILNGIQAMNNHGHMDVLARNIVAPQGHHSLRPGPYVEILVRDRGCGMDPADAARALNESFTRKPNGNGVGLTTCKHIITEHGGQIAVSSMKNVGTEVMFWLPATQPLQGKDAAPVAPPRLKSGLGTILVVDDEERLRKVVHAVLKRCGYRVFEASSGEEAVQAYRQLMRQNDDVDIVIMDLTLKGTLTGEKAMMEICAMDPSAKVIASSGGMLEESREGFLSQGFCDVLPKPYLAADVSNVVHQVLMKDIKGEHSGRAA
ncbi:signal transduction histidine kinase [Roseimicrobium gellanilyticum]|uniref:histidine kinase n=1 Tax=Roseimicrobium gellanilyticum TaxID=748857 RepID=A0A366HHR4_9BACT|nr:ATP-binding protein [Roseimicrobium gellanilyticum]RBP41375.1 signal transduction histidine kinase [Roseimicrobium gellanilyticum]